MGMLQMAVAWPCAQRLARDHADAPEVSAARRQARAQSTNVVLAECTNPMLQNIVKEQLAQILSAAPMLMCVTASIVIQEQCSCPLTSFPVIVGSSSAARPNVAQTRPHVKQSNANQVMCPNWMHQMDAVQYRVPTRSAVSRKPLVNTMCASLMK